MTRLILLLACTSGPATPPPVDTDTDTPPSVATADTGDSGVDPPVPTADTGPVDMGQWTQFITPYYPSIGELWFSDVQVHSVDPLRIAVAHGGFFDGDELLPAQAHITDWPIGASEFDNPGVTAVYLYSSGGTPAQVELVGDVTGDGIDDLTATVGGRIIVEGPLDANVYVTMDGPVWMNSAAQPVGPGFRLTPCDVDADGENDLCTSRGLDLGPIDGTPELFWNPDVALHDETLAVGQQSGATVAYVGTPTGIVRIPIASLLATTGEVDLSTQTTWPATDVSRLMTVDLDGDDTTELLSCARVDGLDRVWLHSDFPSAPTELFTLTNGCTDLEPGDFDGDGQLEIAVGYDSRITLVELDGTERFTHVGITDPYFDGLGAGIDSADVDGDGRDDLIAGAERSRTLYLTLNAIPQP